MKAAHLALYGNAAMVRQACPACETSAFVIDGFLACCGAVAAQEPRRWKRMSESEYARRKITKQSMDQILSEQGHRCLYCERSFGSFARRKGKLIRLSVRWDHMVPFALTQNNAAENMAAACQVCNAWKSSLVFRTLDEARVYLSEKWRLYAEDED